MQERGMQFSNEAAMAKVYALELNQRIAAVGMELLGPYGALMEHSELAVMDGRVPWYYLRSIGNTLEMGSSEIDRNIIAMRGLGLPRG